MVQQRTAGLYTLAISTNPQKGGTTWLEPATEEEYNNL